MTGKASPPQMQDQHSSRQAEQGMVMLSAAACQEPLMQLQRDDGSTAHHFPIAIGESRSVPECNSDATMDGGHFPLVI